MIANPDNSVIDDPEDMSSSLQNNNHIAHSHNVNNSEDPGSLSSSSFPDMHNLDAIANHQSLIEQLKRDVTDYKRQLNEEKLSSKQAAEYGLSLLEDFKKMQNRNYELEGEIETCRSELEVANGELAKVRKTKKLADMKDQSLEHNLLVESADREEKLSSQLNTVEMELGRAKAELQRLYNENERLLIEQREALIQVEQLKDVLLKQKSEIKAVKERENRLLVDNTELDGENVQLQEQIVKLREDLVEMDTIKHENRALGEKLDMQEAQIVEINTLKRIVEKQLEESLNSIREEREHKYQKKREFHERREKQSLQELQNIAKNLNIDYDDVDYDDYDGVGHDTGGELINPLATAGGANHHQNSLMSEMQTVDELQRLEVKLGELGKHRDQLEAEVIEFKSDLSQMIESVQLISKKLPPNAANMESNNNNNSNNNTDTKLGKLALSLVDKLRGDIDHMVASGWVASGGKDELDAFRAEHGLLSDHLSNVAKFVEGLNGEVCKLTGVDLSPSENAAATFVVDQQSPASVDALPSTALTVKFSAGMSKRQQCELVFANLKILKSNMEKGKKFEKKKFIYSQEIKDGCFFGVIIIP